MNHPHTSPRIHLEHDLDAIAANAAQKLRARSTAHAFQASLGEAVLWLLPAPLLVLLTTGLGHLFGVAVPKPGVFLLLLLTILPAALHALIRTTIAATRPSDRHAALGALDHQLGLSDRLLTAAVFLEEPSPTPFMEAAIEDAREVTSQALAAELKTGGRAPDRWWAPPMFVIAGLLAAVACWVPPSTDRSRSFRGDPGITSTAEVEDRAGTSPPPKDPRDVNMALPTPERGQLPPTAENATSGKPRGGDVTKGVKKAEGKTGEGRSAEASTASGSNDSRSTPSSQAQASKAAENKTKKPSKAKKKRPEVKSPTAPKKKEESSGETAGRGAASGSNRSPAASEWSSKDQVTSDDEEDLEQDEDVDDESEESEARGGLQPQLRDRKPPVNRDLSIGFGNQPNPDANGRGGPSEQKKSRGVASLVLGVPIPDHIKGKPNPGRTKITQERVEPRAEELAALSAQPRDARQHPVGHLSKLDLPPWMRRIVRTYSLSLRKNSQSPTR